MDHFQIRNTMMSDQDALQNLYFEVASRSGGILRTPGEITSAYIGDFLSKSIQNGVALSICHPTEKEKQIAHIHSYMSSIVAFRHVLMNTSIVVHPDFQSRGLGKKIFKAFLEKIEQEFAHIYRVELNVRSKAVNSIKFYEKMGFVIEGKLFHQIMNPDGSLETPLSMYWINPKFDI